MCFENLFNTILSFHSPFFASFLSLCTYIIPVYQKLATKSCSIANNLVLTVYSNNLKSATLRNMFAIYLINENMKILDWTYRFRIQRNFVSLVLYAKYIFLKITLRGIFRCIRIRVSLSHFIEQ